MGNSVQHVTNGPDALRALESSLPDLALIDIGLPGMSGYELAELLRADPRWQNLVLVALTGYASEKDRQRSHAAGFDAHYAKPMDFKVLPSLQRRTTETTQSDESSAAIRRDAATSLDQPGVVP